ncbi:MAG: HpcH/HpaI aldolase/citrate lyase family protein [Aliishimia sp.]
MPAPINPLKRALAAGETTFGSWSGLGDANSAEVMAGAGFDWLVVDNEHSPNDLRSTRDQLVAMEASDTHAVVRVPIGETWMIKQMLDIGAQSLLVPMVESGEQAQHLVAACRYPPHGIRGVGAALGRASKFNQIEDYAATADAQVCVILQVESRAGFAALDDILAVEGVDSVFIGPADLAADMGHIANPMHPEVVAAIIDAITRIKAAGKAPGILSMNDDMISQSLEAGAQFLAVGVDVLILANSAKAIAKKWKG